MKTILNGWHIMRMMRLALGLIAIWQAIQTGEWMLGIAGGLVAGLAIANKGCCPAAGCTTPVSRVRRSEMTTQDVGYEEVVEQK